MGDLCQLHKSCTVAMRAGSAGAPTLKAAQIPTSFMYLFIFKERYVNLKMRQEGLSDIFLFLSQFDGCSTETLFALLFAECPPLAR